MVCVSRRGLAAVYLNWNHLAIGTIWHDMALYIRYFEYSTKAKDIKRLDRV